jgi:hypothetical protein
MVLYLAYSLSADLDLSESLHAQVAVFLISEEDGGNAVVSRRALNRWLVDFWRQRLDRQGFRFAAPGVLRDHLQGLRDSQLGREDVAKLLQVALTAVGTAAENATMTRLRAIESARG